MPLDSTRLRNAIKSALDSISSSSGPRPRRAGESDAAYRSRLEGEADDDRTAAAQAIAEAVISEIRSNATVTGMCPPGTAGGPLTSGRVT